MVSSLRPSNHPVLLSSLFFLCNSSGASRNWTVGSSNGVNFVLSAAQCTNYTDAYALMVPSVHPTVCFLFLSLLDFDPRKIDYLVNLACGILASLGPRSVCKTPDFHRKPESLYHRDSPWINGYRVQNVSQISTQSHTSHLIKLRVH
jgi:hypothetical protein